MKKLLFILVAGLFVTTAQAQKKADEAVKFDQEVHDFGKIKQGVPVTYDFVFRNVTSAPITITNATASCGCTTPVKPEAPIMPGKADKIKAGYNAANPGPFEKTIYITVEGYDQPKEIKIKGEVVNGEAVAPAPQLAPVTDPMPAPAPAKAKQVAKAKTPAKPKVVRKS
jgi:hypothetical protein